MGGLNGGSLAAGALKALVTLVTLAIALGYLAAGVLGAGFAIVEGRSMEPLFHTGDLVVLVPVERGGVAVGDIVVYEKGGKYIIHRVIYVYESPGGELCLVTKGDNNPVPDAGFPTQCSVVLVPGYGPQAGVPLSAVKGKVLEVAGVPVKVPYVGGVRLALDALRGAG